MSTGTERERTGESEDEHAMVGAYALNAVDERERAEFEVHLAGCPLCSVDVPAFREVLAELATRASSAPPPDLIARALTRTRDVQQERARRGRGLRGLRELLRRPRGPR
jgi:anti-sigma factor RsiW